MTISCGTHLKFEREDSITKTEKGLRNSFKKNYGRYSDLIKKYQRSVKDMMAYSCLDQLKLVVQLVLSSFLY